MQQVYQGTPTAKMLSPIRDSQNKFLRIANSHSKSDTEEDPADQQLASIVEHSMLSSRRAIYKTIQNSSFDEAEQEQIVA